MSNILDQLPPGVEVPKRIMRSYRLLILFIEGWHDAIRGQRQYTFGDDFHRTQGRKAIGAYIAGYDASEKWRADHPDQVEAAAPA